MFVSLEYFVYVHGNNQRLSAGIDVFHPVILTGVSQLHPFKSLASVIMNLIVMY